MSDSQNEYLEVFPTWLASLNDDVHTVLNALKSETVEGESRRLLVSGINYFFKSLDLVPDGVAEIGYLDDAFVLRLVTKAALDGEITGVDDDIQNRLGELASDTSIILEFLEKDIYARFENYVNGLTKGAARGRTVDEIVAQTDVFEHFVEDAQQFIENYRCPTFEKDAKNLVKLKAFLDAKLPQ